MHLISPQNIYTEVLKETDVVLSALTTHSESEELSNAIETARNSFLQLKSEADATLLELDKNAEWDALTIALYGETNAGKSTIIETLRILMGEKTKQEQQQKFREVREKYNINENVADVWKNKNQEITQLEESLNNLSSQFGKLQAERKAIEYEINSQIELLAKKIKAIPFWRRYLSFAWAIPEKSELNITKKKLSIFITETYGLSQEYEQEKIKIVSKIDSAKKQVADIDTGMRELETLQDGGIIGDGQSDFTRESKRYEFTANGNKFVLLDVPGIEGKEELVREPIMQAVRKAHAVFYVTRKADPPQKGDEKTGEKGTLEKIKEHLGAQTEVWTIFNKSIKSPEQLRQPQLINKGEEDSLKILENEMHQQLGEHYAGIFCISAYPSFIASSDHFLPGNAKSKDRVKFLAVMDALSILQKTGIQRLAEQIGTKMAEDAKVKIRRSNFNKANNTVLALAKSVTILNKKNFKPLFENLNEQALNSISQLDSAKNSLKSNIDTKSTSLIKKNRDKVRRKIYNIIDDDISNSDFKSYLEDYIESASADIEQDIPKVIEKQISIFQDDVKDIAIQFKEHVQEFIDDASIMSNTNFSLDIKIDNGINVAGLIGGTLGAVAMVFATGGLALVAGIISAIGVVVSIAKAVWGFFDSDYKKAQQRKAADENIEKIFRAIQSSYSERLGENMSKLQDKLGTIKSKFNLPAQQAEKITKLLDNSAQKLELISHKIIKEGGLK